VARNEARLTDHAAEFDVPFAGRRIMKFTARHLLSRDTNISLVLLSLEDVTDLLNDAERLGVQRVVAENMAEETEPQEASAHLAPDDGNDAG